MFGPWQGDPIRVFSDPDEADKFCRENIVGGEVRAVSPRPALSLAARLAARGKQMGFDCDPRSEQWNKEAPQLSVGWMNSGMKAPPPQFVAGAKGGSAGVI